MSADQQARDEQIAAEPQLASLELPSDAAALPMEAHLARVAVRSSNHYTCDMSTLSEIEAAADALPAQEKQELLLFLATRLRAQSLQLPPPRRFSSEQMKAWIAEDEADMLRFRDTHSS
jgi:hypothetical protein